ncbi:hypothetical protein GON03_00710 [Nocardioides sp. MAH-18]|uniref:Uncharacterized protein n=1 Tax=Nocardioides agri TaxID=2682843 RepID=A0A6L6XKG4_9ACTN|nr:MULTISPECIES: hypothetical protein [unclassified Nocardioides]MBA2956537.1 hypothetical protein [Nocardioides sp. CGMCC 1.13656]MVQ47684.1 hypothetical protein [Nocardioides sp. MAH-18]
MPEHTRADPFGLFAGGEGTITGTVVSAAVLAYAGDDTGSLIRLCLTVFATVAVYWLAHLHAETIGSALTHAHHPRAALQHAMGETWPILGASAAPIAALVAATLVGAELRTAAWIALWICILLLVGYSYIAGLRGGLDLRGRIGSAAAGLGLGLLVVALKVALH